VYVSRVFSRWKRITYALHSHTYRIEYNLFKNFTANFTAESDETRRVREKEGYDADLTIVDMNMKKVIKNDWIASKCGWTPFDGYEVKGFPLGTIVNGKAIVWDGKLIEKANGKPLKF
jgi:dihydroorotase